MFENILGVPIIEQAEKNMIAYTLEAETDIDNAEYTVMKKQNDGQFVDCFRLAFNGKPQFVFLSGELQPVGIYLRMLDGEQVSAVIKNIFLGLKAIETIGFLDIGKVDCSLNRIFIEPKTFAPKFIYLPVRTRNTEAGIYMLQALRQSISEFLVKMGRADIPAIRSIIGVLNNPSFMTLSAICRSLTGGETSVVDTSDSDNNLLLISRQKDVQITIVPKEYILRRKEVAEGNKRVGRQHARMFFQDKKWYIEDLDSANGTSVNGKNVSAGNPVEICPGDILYLADEQYYIEKG